MSIISSISKNKRLSELEQIVKAQTEMIVLLDMYMHSIEAALIESKAIDKDRLNAIRAQILKPIVTPQTPNEQKIITQS